MWASCSRRFLPFLTLLILLTGCARFELPYFDTFDSSNPIRTSRSYKKEAVRGLKNILARHCKNAQLQAPGASKNGTTITLRNGENAVCRLYVGEDWLGFQLCDPQERDWSQPIYASALDSEDRRVIQILLRY